MKFGEVNVRCGFFVVILCGLMSNNLDEMKMSLEGVFLYGI